MERSILMGMWNIMLQSFKLALKSIWGNKMRSFLTMLGIIIGVSSVIILVGLVNGQMSYIRESYADMGMNQINVMLTNTPSRTISVGQMYEFYHKNRELIKEISPQINLEEQVRYKTQKLKRTTIIGVSEHYLKVLSKKLSSGRFLQYSDMETRQAVCVLGYYGATTLFGSSKEAIGKEIKLGNTSLTVVGVMEMVDGEIDDILYLPYSTAMQLNKNANVERYVLTAVKSESVEETKEFITKMLMETYKSPDLFYISSNMEIIKSMKSTLTMMSATLGGIAGISLLVAGVGVMNIMLVSVTERTREIGIRKSLGAKRRMIMQQFVIEAAVTSSLGGIIGIGVGSMATPFLGSLMKTKAYASPLAIGVSFGVSVAIGLIFGYMPASRAAKLNPIDALKSE